jgi:SH3-like domain-containing protein
MHWAIFVVAALVLTGAPAVAEGLAADQAGEVRISRFSGKPVPRFETLRYGAVNGRSGPTQTHPIIWRYERKGLPVLIIKESEDWARVRDPGGDEVWVQARMLEGGARVLTKTDTVLHKTTAPGSPETARLDAGVLAELVSCAAGQCQIKANGISGWAPIDQLWGAPDSETAPLNRPADDPQG